MDWWVTVELSCTDVCTPMFGTVSISSAWVLMTVHRTAHAHDPEITELGIAAGSDEPLLNQPAASGRDLMSLAGTAHHAAPAFADELRVNAFGL